MEKVLIEQELIEQELRYNDEWMNCFKGMIQVIENKQNVLKAILQVIREPKLSAKDFPCLDYYANRITFNDGKNMYTISEDFKQIIRSARATEEIIDENVEIVECQLREIQKGDCFAWGKEVADTSDVRNYAFCIITNYVSGTNWYNIDTILPHAHNFFMQTTTKVTANEQPVYKFILRNK